MIHNNCVHEGTIIPNKETIKELQETRNKTSKPKKPKREGGAGTTLWKSFTNNNRVWHLYGNSMEDNNNRVGHPV